MSATMNNNDVVRGFEVRVFGYAIIVAFFFRLVRSIHELLIDSPLPVVLVGLFNLFLFLLIFWMYRKHFQLASIICYFQILLTSVLTWNNAGGWNGSIPYIFLVVMVTIVITSHGVLRIIFLLAYGLVMLLFSQSTILNSLSSPNQNYSQLSTEVDFIVITLILLLITLYLKKRFFAYRDSVELTNARLLKSTETLVAQTQKLHDQQAELNTIRGRLETTATGKVNEVKIRAEILDEYGFVNAHHVRGALARVLGLIHLIELEEPDHPRSEAFQNIKSETQEMDTIVRKINDVIS
jgi:hypothetical protein